MERDPIEIVRAGFDAISRGDLALAFEVFSPAVRFRSRFAVLGEEGVYRGHDGLRDYFRDLDEAFERRRIELDQALSVGTTVLGVGEISYTGRRSGIVTTEQAGWIWRIEDGRAVEFRAFSEPEAAIRAIAARTAGN